MYLIIKLSNKVILIVCIYIIIYAMKIRVILRFFHLLFLLFAEI
jgi:hypothetical protein